MEASHPPSLAFQPFRLNSAVIGDTVVGVLLIFAHLTAETTAKSRAVSAHHKNLQKVWGLGLWMSTRCSSAHLNRG